ncbi:hypothetical protein [Pendulispora albinea]|uniref:Outer membrane protein assembly factor BamD n=1 Tax=Pendulispora albinea TaxID=2741071 RepID=A0ABZ2M8J0_9BACT
MSLPESRARVLPRPVSAIVAAGIVATVLFASPLARADDISKQARADYDLGAAAYERKDYATAAKHFARADERIPNSRALQLAMASSLAGSDPLLAMALVERAEARAVDGTLAELAQRLRKRFASSAGKIRLVCPSEVHCRATIDNREGELEHGRGAWVTPGKHTAHIRATDATSSERAPVLREVTVTGGATFDVTASAAELAPPATKNEAAEAPKTAPTVVQPPAEILPEYHSKGIAPVYFWTALGATAVAAGTATVFTIMTKSRHDDFVSNPSQQTADDGQSAQTRARIVWGITGALAATTIVVAALTDFGHSQKSTAAKQTSSPLSVAVGPGSVLLVGRFR